MNETIMMASTKAESQNYRLVCFSEAMSPITHAARSEGNENVVMREPVVTSAGVRWIPCLSGNALRHRAIRESGFRWLVDEYALAGTLTLNQLNFIFHGGNLTEGGGRENTARIADFQRLFPLGRLLGGCLPDQVLAGKLQVWRGTLVCEENRAAIAGMVGTATSPMGGAIPEHLRPAESFLGAYQYTRGDARKSLSGLATTESRAADSAAGVDSTNLMIFAGQQVMRGSAFIHGFDIPHGTQVEYGALLWSLCLWQAKGGTIGGQSARGHGRLATSILGGDDPGLAAEQTEAIAAYQEHARAVRDEAVAWLHGVFAPRAEKPARAGKNGKATKSPVLVGVTEGNGESLSASATQVEG